MQVVDRKLNAGESLSKRCLSVNEIVCNIREEQNVPLYANKSTVEHITGCAVKLQAA